MSYKFICLCVSIAICINNSCSCGAGRIYSYFLTRPITESSQLLRSSPRWSADERHTLMRPRNLSSLSTTKRWGLTKTLSLAVFRGLAILKSETTKVTWEAFCMIFSPSAPDATLLVKSRVNSKVRVAINHWRDIIAEHQVCGKGGNVELVVRSHCGASAAQASATSLFQPRMRVKFFSCLEHRCNCYRKGQSRLSQGRCYGRYRVALTTSLPTISNFRVVVKLLVIELLRAVKDNLTLSEGIAILHWDVFRSLRLSECDLSLYLPLLYLN